MTHDEALRILLPRGRGEGSSPPTGAAEEAEAHLLGCVDCWNTVHAVYRLVTGEPFPEAESLAMLYGCGRIRPRLPSVVDIPLTDIRHREPEIAAHLERCTQCREQFLDLLVCTETWDAVPATTPDRPRWVAVAATHGERLLEVVGEFVVRVREGAAALAQWPPGMEPVPVGVVGAPMRGAEDSKRGPDDSIPPVGGEPPERRFELDLGDTNLSVNLVIEPQGERVRLSLLAVRGDRPIAVALRRIEGDREYVVAAQSTATAEEFVATELQPGRYQLEVRERQTPVRYRIRLSIERND